MATLPQGFPLANQVFVEDGGRITYPWYQFLVTLWNRTGGATGTTGTAGLMQSLAIDYGALEDNATDDSGAIDAWIADPDSSVVWVESRTYTTNILTDFSKRGMGPGSYRLSAGQSVPAAFLSMQTMPDVGTGADLNYYFSGDLSKMVRSSYTRFGAAGNNLRKSPTQKYFESVSTPLFDVFINFSGWSGVTCRATAGTAIGATSVAVNSASGVTTGDTICWFDANGLVLETRVVTVSGATLSWSGGLAHAYTNGQALAQGPRTMNALQYQQVGHGGGGDSYCTVSRVEVFYTPTASQTHFFETATGGLYGGDLVFSTADGNYGTGVEISYSDNGRDVAVISSVQSFFRTNNTGARSVVWIGAFYQSVGSQPIDAFAVYAGKSRIGTDYSRADFSSNANAAIQLATEHRIYMNSVAITTGPGTDPRGIYPPFTSNDPGTIYMEGNSDGTSEYWAAWNGTARIRLRPTALQINVDTLVTGDVNCNNVAVISSGLIVFGAASGNYFSFSGGLPHVHIAGVDHTLNYT